MKYSRRLLYVIAGISSSLVIVSDGGAADTRPHKENDGNAPWAMNLQGGYVHLFDTDLDQGGSFSVNRFYVQGGPAYRPRYERSISLSVGYGYDSYDFSGMFDNFSSPWEKVHTLRLSAPVRWGHGDFSFIAVPTLRFSAENTSDWSDGFTGGGFAGVSYRVSERLTIGPGLGMLSQIEKSASVFPILVVSWKITDKLNLETGKGVASTLGPGLTLNLRVTDELSFFAGSRYEKNRFRLDKNGSWPGGIGEDSLFPLFGGLYYAFTKDIKASIIGGISIGGQLSLEDRDGNLLVEEDYGSTPFLGVSLSGKL